MRGVPPAADCECRQPWFAVLRLRDSSQNGIRWPAILTGIRRSRVVVFVKPAQVQPSPRRGQRCRRRPGGQAPELVNAPASIRPSTATGDGHQGSQPATIRQTCDRRPFTLNRPTRLILGYSAEIGLQISPVQPLNPTRTVVLSQRWKGRGKSGGVWLWRRGC